MAFGIAKGFGLEKLLVEQLNSKFTEQKEIVNRIITFSENLLNSTSGGVIAGIGVALLFWTIIKVLGNIEQSFNDIWGVKKSRSLGRKFSDYLSFMLISPIIFIMASSMTVVVSAKITAIVNQLTLWGWVGSLILLLLKILPFSLIWGLFTFTYLFMPNTKVNFTSGLIGGIIAGTLYQFGQRIYLMFQISVSNFNAIYGSFAALPLFLTWLQISWLIVLYGAEIAFAHQNVDTYEFEPDCLKVSPGFKRLVTLGVVHLCVKKFKNGEAPLTAKEISQQMDIPIRLLNQIIFELVETKILSEVKKNEDKVFAYQPSKNLDELTVQSIINQLDKNGIDNIPVIITPELEKFTSSLKIFEDLKTKSEANFKLQDI
jgi:membrane protein